MVGIVQKHFILHWTSNDSRDLFEWLAFGELQIVVRVELSGDLRIQLTGPMLIKEFEEVIVKHIVTAGLVKQ